MARELKAATDFVNDSRRYVIVVGHRSERRINITATLPLEFLDSIDELIDEDIVPSRSYAIREAVKKYVEALQES
ncbi:MAG TPA: ribbon-helix-helix domain-containing protein [Candidatus Acidoferrum sp.]|nr:ribbon-helix-helix domain-containing protein [Candidatus Acidoferrum sp.]